MILNKNVKSLINSNYMNNFKYKGLYHQLKYIIFLVYIILILYFYNYLYFLNHIHIAMSLNNNYVYPIMVSITSILLNSNKTTYIHFHILIGQDVERKNIIKIKSLKKFHINSNFIYYNVGKYFKGWKHGKKKLTVASFYRMILGQIIKNLKKIIYLDGDTLTYNDLNEMYNLNITNLYFKGVREIVPNFCEKTINTSKYICAGVMLMNLELMRKENVFDKFKDYYLKYYKKRIYYGDQHIINHLFIDKIGYLPPKFGMWFIDSKDIENYKNLTPLIYTENELIESINKPIIRHIWGKTKEGNLPDKPWLISNYSKIKEEWNYYAKKTGYYSYICKSFKNACININLKK